MESLGPPNFNDLKNRNLSAKTFFPERDDDDLFFDIFCFKNALSQTQAAHTIQAVNDRFKICFSKTLSLALSCSIDPDQKLFEPTMYLLDQPHADLQHAVFQRQQEVTRSYFSQDGSAIRCQHILLHLHRHPVCCN